MAENFTSYTETDPNNRFAVSSSRVTVTDLLSGEDQHYVYSDKGASFFDGNFSHLVTLNITASEKNRASGVWWAMTNDIDDFRGLVASSKDGFFLYATHPNVPDALQLSLIESDGGSLDQSTLFTMTAGTVYYLKITRDESLETYGTIFCRIYTDAARTVLVTTLQITLNSSKKDFRYLFAVMSSDETAATTKKISGYVENLTLQESSPPVVTTETTTTIAETTATGIGIITSLGSSSVTQHGHCWSTSPNPTTSDSCTTKGIGSLGLFTSSITGLTVGTTYNIRAYATNLFGTVYGANLTFDTQATNAPSVTTEPSSDLTTTTATGNGTITDVGASDVTEHGHVWAITVNPTTSDSKTTNGLGFFGTFTSSITGLTSGTTYFIRAYATNTQGTSYGNNIVLIAGVASGISSEIAGPIRIFQENIQYFDGYGTQRYVHGTPVL